MEKTKILIAEDDRSLNFLVKSFLENKNFEIQSCIDGEQAIKLSKSQEFDLAIIDLFLPKFNGITVLRRIRDKSQNCPVIMITDSFSEINEIETYKSGANILHKKPINYNILEAQVNSLIKPKEKQIHLEIGDLYINPKLRLCIKDKKEIYLTYNEFNLLYLFASNPGRIFSRDEILSKVLDSSASHGAVDTLVSRLRSKVGTYNNNSVIETVVKSGFRLSIKYYDH